MIIYADITFINNFLMTFAIIWAIANIMEIRIKWLRLVISAIIANLYFLIVLYIQLIYFNQVIYIIFHILLNMIAAVIIIKISFPDLSNSKFIKAIAYLYFITFITIGTTISLFYILGGSPFASGIQKLLAGILVLFFIGNFGWKIFRKYKAPEEFLLPINLYYHNKKIAMIGLLDTGNSLTDPITNVPVIVVNLEDVLQLFTEELQKELILVEDDYMEIIELFNNYDMGDRIRLLPFSDLGQENGLLIGIRPDLVELDYKGELRKVRRCVIALSKRKLDIDNEYQALIHPKIFMTP